MYEKSHRYEYRHFIWKNKTLQGSINLCLWEKGKNKKERELIQRKNGKKPHWWRNPSPVVTSSTNKTSTASIAALPFQVSALLVQPHSHTVTGGGSSLRCESYAANNSSTLPSGTKDWTIGIVQSSNQSWETLDTYTKKQLFVYFDKITVWGSCYVPLILQVTFCYYCIFCVEMGLTYLSSFKIRDSHSTNVRERLNHSIC